MENASRALLIAGGVLMGIIILSLLIIMFTQMGDFQRAHATIDKDSQLAKFNSDFEKYADDSGIDGTDIISLANKVSDYNEKEKDYYATGSSDSINNSVDYTKKITLEVSNMNDFTKKYAYDEFDSLFAPICENGKIVIRYDGSTYTNTNRLAGGELKSFKNIVDSYNGQEISTLKSLASAATDNSANKNTRRRNNIVNIQNRLYDNAKSIAEQTAAKNWNGQRNNQFDEIIHYKEYSEFKSSKFKIDSSKYIEYYSNGQIKAMYFKFVK